MKKFVKNHILLILVALGITAIVFRKYIFEGLVPIPADTIVGLYYPWFDYKWGYETPVPVKNSLPTDIVSILYPWRTLGIQILKQGFLPLWDKHILLGVPLFANFQAALLNPLNILYLVLDEINTWSIQVVLQVPLMIGAVYAFLRSIKYSKIASVFAGVLYALSGYSIVWMEYNSINYTLIFLPLILLATNKIFFSGSSKWIILGSLFVLGQLIVGYPLNAVYTLAVSFMYFFYLCLLERNFAIKKFILLMMSVLIGFGLAGIQLIPSAELYIDSIRSFDNLALASQVKYLPVSHLIMFFVPDFFGNPATGNYDSIGSYDNFAFGLSSVGIFFFLVFIASGKFLAKKKVFLVTIFLLVTLYVTENPLTRLLQANDILGFKASVNTRALYVLSFVSSLMSASGLDLYLKNKVKIWYLIIPPLFYGVILLSLFFLFKAQINSDIYSTFLTLLNNKQEGLSPSTVDTLISLRNSIIPSIFVLMLFVVLAVRKKTLSILSIFLLLILSTTMATDKYLSFVRADMMYPETELGNFMKESIGDGRFLKDERSLIFPSNTWSMYGLNSPSGQNASTPLSIAKYLSVLNRGVINDQLFTRYIEIDAKKSPLVRTLNVEYLLSINMDEKDSPSPNGKPRLFLLPEGSKEVNNIKTVSVFKNEGNLGPAWFPEKIVCELDEDKISNNISRSDYDPKKIVYVSCLDGNEFQPGDNKIVFTTSSPQGMSYKYNLQKESYLVLSNTYYPGWYYSVSGGEPRSVENSANIGLMAIRVPAGEQSIDVYYDPPSLKIGATVSLLSALLLLVFGVWSRSKSRI